jgi:valyl-tRNA synthetase
LMVTRQLKKDEHKTPRDIGREEFTKRVWTWKEKFGGTITNQIRREGLSVDWTRERFTMDESLSRAVREVFVRLYEQGKIYRGKRIVNWCPNDQTVLSDLEVQDTNKKDGKLFYLNYPIKNSDEKITVATTRPETMLGDAAVAVNADDERYKNLIGEAILLPLTNREIPIIADEYVDAAFGTGAVKITPAHDPNDYEVGIRHNLSQIEIMDARAKMNENAGADFQGLDRYAARAKVVEKFEELGLLEKIDDYEIVLPVCERCKTVVEPLLSEQWFLQMDEMRDLALDLIKREHAPHFFPQVPHEKVYKAWLENLKDWTISRQLWWGHQIPAWYDEAGNTFVARTKEEAIELAGTENLTQDADVLDTWFSSALWAFSTLGWTGEEVQSPKSKVQSQDDGKTLNFGLWTLDLKTFYPTDVLVTGRDIIRLWVSRMVMTGLKFVGEKPFRDVIIHGTVLDKNGQRMSKTKNNGIDPLDVFDKYGVDATRMTLADSATGVDFAWREEKVESFRNFANKIWNATRFCLLNSDGAQVDYSFLNPKAEVKEIKKTLGDELNEIDEEDEEFLDKVNPAFAADNPKENLSLADKWIISQLNKTALNVNKSLDKYDFHDAVQTLYHFFWDDFCDWYIELVKDEITAQEPNVKRDAARSRVITILEQSLRLLHPFMPFLTEELWQKLPEVSKDLHNGAYRSAPVKTVMLADFPRGDVSLIDEDAARQMQMVIELISKVRNIRAEMNIKPSDKPAIHVAANNEAQKIFRRNEAQILKLARAAELKISETLEVPKASAKAVLTGGAEIAVPLEGLIDFQKESERLAAQIEKLSAENERLEKQLANENFVERAPAEKVEEIRARVAEIQTQSKALTQNLEALK